jgi:hypothetical protein
MNKSGKPAGWQGEERSATSAHDANPLVSRETSIFGTSGKFLYLESVAYREIEKRKRIKMVLFGLGGVEGTPATGRFRFAR